MTIINDPKLKPYYIGKDAHCYTVFEKIIPVPRYTDSGKDGEEYTKSLGHYSSFGQALKSIMKAKVNGGVDKTYSSIQEYITEWNRIENELKTLTEFNEL